LEKPAFAAYRFEKKIDPARAGSTRGGEEAKQEAAEAHKEEVGRPKNSAQNRDENFPAIPSENNQERWFNIAARKAHEAGITLATQNSSLMLSFSRNP
jgi:hypothetical protein